VEHGKEHHNTNSGDDSIFRDGRSLLLSGKCHHNILFSINLVSGVRCWKMTDKMDDASIVLDVFATSFGRLEAIAMM
jgi:hypothetical protein